LYQSVVTEITRTVVWQGNREMQRVFPTPDDSSIVVCFRFRKVKAVIAPQLVSLRSVKS